MTYKEKYRENKKLISLYSDFLFSGEKIKPDGTLKLINEIARLDSQNRHIEEMPFRKIDNDINDYTIQI